MPRMFIFGLVVSMVLSSGVRAEEALQEKPADGGVSAPNAAQAGASNAPDSTLNSAGAAFADFDNDGLVDLYVTNFTDQLARNRPQPLSEYWVGIDATPPDDALRAQLELPAGQGLVVNQIVAGSAAEKAGLKQYDVLISCNDVPLKEIGDLAKIVEQKKESPLTLRLVRGGKRITVEVTPQRRPASQTGEACPAVSKVDDQEFVNRVWLDLLGTPAAPEDVHSFLNEKRQNKREWLVNRLLRNSTTTAKSCTKCHADDVQGWHLFQSIGGGQFVDVQGIVPHWDATVFKYADGDYGQYVKRLVGLPEAFLQFDQPVQSLPDDVSVSITYKKGEPAKLTVKQGEKSWEATAADYREKLPENLRGYVESLIPAASAGAAKPSHLRWNFNKLLPQDAHLYWKAYNPIAEPQPPASTPPASPSESVLQKLDKQIESLESQLGDLRKAMQELRQATKGPK